MLMNNNNVSVCVGTQDATLENGTVPLHREGHMVTSAFHCLWEAQTGTSE